MSSSLSRSAQYKKYERKKLSHLLGFDVTDIQALLDAIEKNYTEWSETKLDKQGNAKKYLDGTVKMRYFRNPSTLLKEVQKRIKRNILDKQSLPNCVHGGIKGRSNITNANEHKGKKYRLETDLQEFYPNINSQRVYNLFCAIGYSTHIAHWLTKLTTVKNELPQGSPASTAIANLVFRDTDYVLLKLCEAKEITYTRYVDDLTFSSAQDFSLLVIPLLTAVLNGDFKISHRKTKYQGGLPVTGIDVFLNKIDAPKHILAKAKQEVLSNADQKPYTQYVKNIHKVNSSRKKSARKN